MSSYRDVSQLSEQEAIMHSYFMQEAMQQAELAEAIDEVPVGAIVVLGNEIIGRGHNKPITQCDPSLHAEMVAIRDAARNIQNYRLIDASLYVTLEPCPMCAGLLVHSRIKQLVFAAKDEKAGAAGTLMNLVQHPQLNHTIDIIEGVRKAECSHQLSSFFRKKRALKKQTKAALSQKDKGLL
jgi:tRNA(adenine34) deaminase